MDLSLYNQHSNQYFYIEWVWVNLYNKHSNSSSSQINKRGNFFKWNNFNGGMIWKVEFYAPHFFNKVVFGVVFRYRGWSFVKKTWFFGWIYFVVSLWEFIIFMGDFLSRFIFLNHKQKNFIFLTIPKGPKCNSFLCLL